MAKDSVQFLLTFRPKIQAENMVIEKRKQASNKTELMRNLSSGGAILQEWGILKDIQYLFEKGYTAEMAINQIAKDMEYSKQLKNGDGISEDKTLKANKNPEKSAPKLNIQLTDNIVLSD